MPRASRSKREIKNRLKFRIQQKIFLLIILFFRSQFQFFIYNYTSLSLLFITDSEHVSSLRSHEVLYVGEGEREQNK